MAPWISPFQDAIQHVISQTDKICKLEVKYINAVKGRGVFAKGTICKGDFVVQYRGDMISDAESQRRRKLYHPSCAAFMFAFKSRGKTWCIDASREDGSIGRLVNDEHRRPNSKMKKMYVNGVPHLCVFALDDIKEGEEITYDYGSEDFPWRTQTTSITVDTMEEDDSDPVHSESLMDGAFAPKTTPEETTSITVDTIEEDDSDPVHSESLIDGAFAPKTTPEETTSITVDTMEEDDSDSVHSESLIDGAFAPNTTPEEITEFENETETFVPKLRRTKSILVKDTDLEDSELFDSSSESADDYVPDTKSDSDSDPDSSIPVCDSTTPDNMILDSHNITPEAPRAVEEPCSKDHKLQRCCQFI